MLSVLCTLTTAVDTDLCESHGKPVLLGALESGLHLTFCLFVCGLCMCGFVHMWSPEVDIRVSFFHLYFLNSFLPTELGAHGFG